MADEPESLGTPKHEGSGEDLHKKSLSGGGRWQLIMEDLNGYFKKGFFHTGGRLHSDGCLWVVLSINCIIDRWVEYQYIRHRQFAISLSLL